MNKIINESIDPMVSLMLFLFIERIKVERFLKDHLAFF